MKTIKITNTVSNIDFEVTQDKLAALEGWEYASVREVVEEVAGERSSVYITSKHGRRRFAFVSYLKDQCDDDRRTMLRVLRQTGTLKLLEFTTLDDLALQTDVEILAIKYPYTNVKKPFLIELVAPDWRFYSQTLKEFTTGQTVVLGGAEIPATIPMSFSSVSSEENDATNAGNESTPPTFRIDGPGTQFTIQNQSTGKEFTITYTIVEGQYIEIDALNRTVKLNGISNIYSSLSGDLWELEPGTNDIGFITDGEGATTLLTINYRDAYNGV